MDRVKGRRWKKTLCMGVGVTDGGGGLSWEPRMGTVLGERTVGRDVSFLKLVSSCFSLG